MREIGSGVGGGLAFARNLDHGGDFAFLQNRRAHDFLDGFAALVFGDGHGFKDGRVRDHREMIDYFGAFFAHGARGQGIGAGQWDLAHLPKLFGDHEAQKAVVLGDYQDRDFMRLHREILTDHVHDAVESYELAVRALADNFAHPLFEVADGFDGHVGAVLFRDSLALGAEAGTTQYAGCIQRIASESRTALHPLSWASSWEAMPRQLDKS